MTFSNSRALAQASGRAHADLIGLPLARRRVADAAGRHVDVLLPQRVDDVAGRQLARREPDRVEPDAHRVLALAEDLHVGDTRHAFQRVLDVDVDVVRDEQRRRTRRAREYTPTADTKLLADLLHRHAESGGPRPAAGRAPG